MRGLRGDSRYKISEGEAELEDFAMTNEKNLTLELTQPEAEQFQAFLTDYLEKIRLSNERMDKEEADIQTLKEESRRLLRQIGETLNVETVF
jgi:hypothetical protein